GGRAGLAVTRRCATMLAQPIDEIAFEDASPARRELNDGRPFPKRDQTLECAASEAGDRGGLIVGVDDEPVFPRPRCAVRTSVLSSACRTLRQAAHPSIGMRNN